LPPDVELTLYRFAQEAITNSAKHARPDHVTLKLEFGQHDVILRVVDDGVGMDVSVAQQAALRGDGWGLAGIYERLELVDGSLDIVSAPGAGAELSVIVPVSGSSEEASDESDKAAVG
jgi:two-component system sensor histidine kinase DegS